MVLVMAPGSDSSLSTPNSPVSPWGIPFFFFISPLFSGLFSANRSVGVHWDQLSSCSKKLPSHHNTVVWLWKVNGSKQIPLTLPGFDLPSHTFPTPLLRLFLFLLILFFPLCLLPLHCSSTLFNSSLWCLRNVLIPSFSFVHPSLL